MKSPRVKKVMRYTVLDKRQKSYIDCPYFEDPMEAYRELARELVIAKHGSPCSIREYDTWDFDKEDKLIQRLAKYLKFRDEQEFPEGPVPLTLTPEGTQRVLELLEGDREPTEALKELFKKQ